MRTINGRKASDSVSMADPRLTDDRDPLPHDHTIDALPAGSVIATSTLVRPTSRTDIVVLWTGTSDPISVALAGDLWLGAP